MTSSIISSSAPKAEPQVESMGWNEFWLHGQRLMREHAMRFDIPDLIAYIGPREALQQAQDNGTLAIYVARAEGGLLCGYIGWQIGKHNGLPGARVAHMGPWYVQPACRAKRTGFALMSRSLANLRERGCDYALITLPLRGRRRRREPFGVAFETTFLRRLSDDC